MRANHTYKLFWPTLSIVLLAGAGRISARGLGMPGPGEVPTEWAGALDRCQEKELRTMKPSKLGPDYVLAEALQKHCPVGVRIVLEGRDPKVRVMQDALLSASLQGELGIVQWLVSQGVPVPMEKYSSSPGIDPFHEHPESYRTLDKMAEEKGHKEVAIYLRPLIEARLDRQSKFIAACRRCDWKTAQALLELDAQPNATTAAEPVPALFVALEGNCMDVANALITRGANIEWKVMADRQWKENRSAVQLAIAKGPPELVGLILTHRPDPYHLDSNGWTSLMLAAKRGDLEITRMILAVCASAPMWGHPETDPVAVAQKYGHSAVAELIRKENPRCEEYFRKPRSSFLSNDELPYDVRALLIKSGATNISPCPASTPNK